MAEQYYNAQFLASYPRVEDCPDSDLPEYVFIGRSNVGKSSLLNMLAGRKALAKVSSTPGKTQLINYFMIEKTWHLVDLPGYGYARASKTSKAKWEKMVRGFFLKRQQISCTFLLIDSSIGPQEIDMEFMKWLAVSGVPFVLVYTKTDKENQNVIQKNIKTIRERIAKDWEAMPQEFITSSEKGRGRKELLDFIVQVNKEIQ
jgi:GTP-binding protein